MSKFKLDDEVKLKKKYKRFRSFSMPKIGKVIGESSSDGVVVEFDGWCDGHDATSAILWRQPSGSKCCWYFYEEHLKKV